MGSNRRCYHTRAIVRSINNRVTARVRNKQIGQELLLKRPQTAGRKSAGRAKTWRKPRKTSRARWNIGGGGAQST